MSRRANDAFRCRVCRLHQTLCVCAMLPRIDTKTRLVLVIHRIEHRKTTNTGRFAAMCLTNSETVIRGHEGKEDPRVSWPKGSRPVLLFPSEDAIPIESLRAEKNDSTPFTLVVPDGNWRQASKVRKRVAGLADIPCVTIPEGAPSIYRLRSEAHATGLATMEAIARAMGVLENRDTEEALSFVFRAMVERTLWTRGEIETKDVTGGIPEGAVRHDPQGVSAATPFATR